jgi:hypothetical protein
MAMFQLTSDIIKKIANDNAVLSSIQICALMGASKADKTDFSNRILQNPDDVTWWKIMSYYLVCNYQEFEWTKLSQDRIHLEAKLVGLCIEAIKKLSS